MEIRPLWIAVGEWLEDHKKRSVKPLTYDRLIISYNLMQKYSVSNWPVDQIDCGTIQRYLNELVADGYSMSTIKKQFNLLTAYWKWGTAQGLIEKPVYMGVSLPSESVVHKSSDEVLAYDRLEQKKMLDILMGLEKDQYGVIVLMLETGMRIGEALALEWLDILWSKRAVRIRGTLVRMSTEPVTYVQDSPKSKKSKRTIPLSDRALDILQRLHDRRSNNSPYVFGRPDNPSMPYSYSSVEYHTRRLCKDLDISYKGLHAFRHTFATNCYERGCDVKILSKLLGHADVAITYNIYIHLYGDALEEMRKVIG